MRAKLFVIAMAVLVVLAPAVARADDSPPADCAPGERNSGEITSMVANAGGTVTASGWMRYCDRDSDLEWIGLPAFADYIIFSDGSVQSGIPADSALGVQTGYRLFSRTFAIRVGVTDVCLQLDEVAEQCWTVRSTQTDVSVKWPNELHLDLFALTVPPDPNQGCGNCWGGGDGHP